jgi:hypothetical protein
MKAFPNGLVYGRELEGGMELRDYFAAKAMQAMITNPVLHSTTMETSHKAGLVEEAVLAHMSYVVADAMMIARENKDAN